jgi:hypothetical protein
MLEPDPRFQGNGASSGKSSAVMQNVIEIGATVYKCAKTVFCVTIDMKIVIKKI